MLRRERDILTLEMSIQIHKSHNVTVLLYHLICVAKYRRVVVDQKVDEIIKTTCIEIAKRYSMHFLEIGTDKDHVHFLIQSIPMILPQKIAQIVKSITARKVFEQAPEVKKSLWGGEFWSDGYYIETIGRHNSEQAITQYIKQQGKEKEYILLHKEQLSLFI